MSDSGLLCPKCKSETTVYNSRPKPNGTTKRSRECLHCGYRFKTIETYNFNPKELKDEDYRKNDMLNLRERGLTYEEIGKQFGISKQRVHQIINEVV